MKLHFGLLWFEDSYSAREEAELRAAAAASGFELEITVSSDGSDVESLAERQRMFHLFDLILLDLKLSGGARGDRLAPKVRELFRSTPILFYSGSENESSLRTRMAKERIEGVFCAHRTDGIKFTGRAAELIQDYAHTLNRLSGMRGLAMEVVAEVDIICREVVNAIAVDDLELLAVQFLDNSVCSQSEANLGKYPALPGLPERLKHPATDSQKSFKLFRELLRKHIQTMPEGEEKDNLKALRVSTREYPKRVIDVRNVLGHALETRDDKGWLILDRDGNQFMTVNDFPDHRSNFLGQLRFIRRIRDILIPQN